MESGLEDRNNGYSDRKEEKWKNRLNGVRPRRPEQFDEVVADGLHNCLSQWSPA